MTMAHHLRAAGYRTAIAGKWQLGDGKRGPNRSGFSEYSLWHLFGKRRTPKGSRYVSPKIFQNGAQLRGLEGQYGPDVINAFVRDFITRNKDQPFFVFYSMLLPHVPLTPTPDLPQWRTEPNLRSQAHFPAMVAYMDKLIGQVTAHLEALGLRENTLILFSGDNGTDPLVTSIFQGRTIKGGKGLPYVTGTHVPLIASWPGRILSGHVDEDLVDFSDFVPTVLEATGTTLVRPAPIDGLSFLARMQGRQNAPRPWVYSYYRPLNRRWNWDFRWVHDRRYKLYGDGRMYNIETDPLEHNVLPAAAAADTRAALQLVLNYYRSIGG
jgi:arylsulfatase A